MSLTLAKMSDMTDRIYKRLGEPVAYRPVSGPSVWIDVILTRQGQLSPASIPIKYADGEHTARVKKTDICLPVRGDTITDKDENVYRVEDVDGNFNESESEVSLRQTT